MFEFVMSLPEAAERERHRMQLKLRHTKLISNGLLSWKIFLHQCWKKDEAEDNVFVLFAEGWKISY